MKKKFLLLPLIISSFFTLPVFSEELSTDQTVLYNQLMGQMQTASPKDLEKATSDPDLASLMQVMQMVQNKNSKEAIPVLEKLLKNPKGKSLTPQAKMMIQNLIETMKFMNTEYQD